MNTGAPGGQPPQGQPSGDQPQQQVPRPKIHIFKPEQMRTLPPLFSDVEKTKYEAGLRAFWNQLENNAENTQPHMDAKKKLYEFSKTLASKIQAYRMAQAQAAAKAGQPSDSRPASQGMQAQPSQQGGEGSGGPQNQNAGQRQASGLSKKLLEHINSFPYHIPANITRDTPEYNKYLHDQKGKYVKGLHAMETATTRITNMDNAVAKRVQEGRPLTADEEKDYKEKKEGAQKNYNDAKGYVDAFRRQHGQQNNLGGTANATPDATAAAQQGGNAPPPQQQNGGNSQEAPVRPQLNPQQQVSNTVPNPAIQSTQTVNAAIEQARIQQNVSTRPMQHPGVQMSQGPQMPSQAAPANPNMPQTQRQLQHPGQMENQMQGQMQGHQQIKQEGGGPPQINTAVNQIQNQHRGSVGVNSPLSAIPQSGQPQSATQQPQQQQQQGPPRALSHSAALNQAARSYSSGQGQSGSSSVMGHSHPSAPARESQNVITNKMPIPKHLPDRAIAQPQPVAMAAARPTMSGGPTNGNSILSMPTIPQVAATNNASDSGHILSQGKLYELVRQVTGGGQGLEGGDILSPDVEAVSCPLNPFHRLYISSL